MAHPDLRALLEATEQWIVEVDGGQVRTTIFARRCRLNLAAQHMAHVLCAVADAQHGQPTHELVEIDLESLRVIDAVGTASQDDTDDVGVGSRELVVGQYLAERIEFTQTAGNELSRLRTEVQDDYLLSLHIRCHSLIHY